MEPKETEIPRFVQGSLGVIALAAGTGLLFYGRWLLIPFILAMVVFSLLTPILDWLVLRLRLPRVAAIAVCLLLVLLTFAGFSFALFKTLVLALEIVSSNSEDWIQTLERLSSHLRDLGMPIDSGRLLADLRNRLPAIVGGILEKVWQPMSGLLLTLVFVFFLLASRDSHTTHAGMYAAIAHDIRRYLARIILLAAVTGTAVWGILYVFGLRPAMVFGFLAFLLDFIPMIGPTIATVLPLPVALAQFPDSPSRVILVIAAIEAVELTMGYVVEPKVLGGGVNLHPITVLLAIGFWSLVWGIVGAFLAIPLTAILHVTMKRTATFRPLAELLSGRLPDATELSARHK